MSDAMDPRHADPDRYERERRVARPAPMHSTTDEYLTAIAERGVTVRIPPDSIKNVVQFLAYKVALGELEPCPRCQLSGISLGTEGYTDAAGDSDTRDCSTCHGWTVVKGDA